MSECGHVYKTGCYSCLEIKIDKIENKIDKLSMYKINEAGYKDGYEKGVRDMFKLMSEICKYQEYAEPFCNNDCDNCPIAKKLLKAVINDITCVFNGCLINAFNDFLVARKTEARKPL